MKQALILIDEINRKKEAIKVTKSIYLKNDYYKSILDDIEELKTYCKFKNLDINKLKKHIRR